MNVPRRICIDKFTPAEKAIHDAIQEVEKAGCGKHLTDAINLLQEAQEKVADYVDNVECNEKESFLEALLKRNKSLEDKYINGSCKDCEHEMYQTGTLYCKVVATNVLPDERCISFCRREK